MKEIAVFGLGTLGKSLAISYSNMGGKTFRINYFVCPNFS